MNNLTGGTPTTCIFRIRSYECDLYGHVNNSNYLRFLQETALTASAEAGYPPPHLSELGATWWTDWIDFEYLLPLQYGDSVLVKTRPTGLQDQVLFQSFEYLRLESNELAARARASSRIVDIKTRHPFDIPIEIEKASPSADTTGQTAARDFPDAPPPPPGAFLINRCVNWQELNARGQVDPAVLLGYVEECGMQVIAAHHWPVERLLEENMGILLRRNLIHYLHPAEFQDELEIKTWAFDVRRVSATRHYQITRLQDSTVIARINSLGVWVNLTTGAPRRAPKGFLEDFAPNLVDGVS